MVQTRFRESFTVAGLSAIVRNDEPDGIGALWQAFYARNVLDELDTVLTRDVYCVYHEYTGAANDPYRMTIGYRVAKEVTSTDAFHTVVIPEQEMIMFEVKGPQPQTLIEQWQAIWQQNLNRTYLADYDVYSANEDDTVTVNVGVAR